MFQGDPRGLLALVALAMCWALAIVLAEAQQGGGISQKERALLNRLRDTLGISSIDADTLERELQSRNGLADRELPSVR